MTDPGTNDVDLTEAVQSAVYNAFGTDAFGDELISIPYTHEQVHRGRAYVGEHEFTNVSGGASRNVYMSVAADKHPHIRVHQWTPSAESLRLLIYRNPTNVSGGGDLDVVENANDGGPTPDSTIQQGVTFDSRGTLIRLQGSSGTKDTSTVESAVGEEIILQEDTEYLIVAENLSSNNAIDYLWFNMFGYEG